MGGQDRAALRSDSFRRAKLVNLNAMKGRVTYSLSYPLVLTRACSNRCGYCRFPVSAPGRLPPPRVVRRHLREAARLGATQVELIAGEGIATHPEIVAQVRYYGFDSYVAYLTRLLQMIEATNRRSHLFSLLNIGPLSFAELRVMRPYLCAMRIMLESADPLLLYREAHREAPLKAPDRRLEAILCCGKAGVPITTGILVGIGEMPASRLKAFEIIAQAHQRHGNIQAVRIQMFHPMPGTPMEHFAPLSDDEFLEVVATARRYFPPTIAIQVSAEEHPHMIGDLLEAGADDLGDISVRPQPARDPSPGELVAMIEAEARMRGLEPKRRFPVYDPFCNKRWYPGGFPDRIARAQGSLSGPGG